MTVLIQVNTGKQGDALSLLPSTADPTQAHLEILIANLLEGQNLYFSHSLSIITTGGSLKWQESGFRLFQSVWMLSPITGYMIKSLIFPLSLLSKA